MKLPKPILHTDFIDGERLYWASEQMQFDSGEHLIIIPAGFLSDGLSIPRLFRSIFSKSPSYIFAGVVHDWLYKMGTYEVTRKEADKIFLYWMKQYGVGWLTRRTIYRAVRIGARRTWKVRPASFAKEGCK